MASILSRLERLETMQPDSLTVVCKLPTGEETILTADDCIAAGADFIRVQAGNRIKDVHKLLDYIAGPDCAID